MKIPIFRLNFSKSFIKNYNFLSKKIFLSKSISDGDVTRKFEIMFARKNESKYALAVNSCTSALEIAFRAINVKNKEVIIPTNTFFGTAIPINRAGGRIVLCDNEKDSPEISFEDIKKKITKNTIAICIVHVGGIIYSRIRELVKLCKTKRIFLIEDSAHAHFSNIYGVSAGNFGDIGCFSFFPTKVMTTGEGGMIVTSNLNLYRKMNSIKNFGRSKNPLILNNDGSNFKISEFSSALGILELSRVDSRIRKRTILNNIYINKLKNNKNFEVLRQKSGKCSNYKCIVKSKIPSNIIEKKLKKSGISLTGMVWQVPIHRQKLDYLRSNNNFKNCDHFSKFHFCLPNYPELSIKEAISICNLLNKYFS